jgi:hypothetical protein
MLSFNRLDIIIAQPEAPPSGNARILVCWELVTQHSGIGQVEFAVERSLSPQFSDDEFDVIESGIAGVDALLAYEAIDITANLINWWRKYFYRVRATTPDGDVVSEIRTWETSPRPHELEIIRRHDFVLQYLQGAPSFAFVERTTASARCVCYDATSGRSSRSNCTLCLNTGRQRPYFAPIPFFVDYNPDEQLVQVSNFGEIQPKEKDCWFSAYPQVKPGDLVYEVMPAVLWRIALVKTIQPMGTTIQHVCRLNAITREQVEYSRLVQQIPDAELRGIVQEWEKVKEERLF